MTDSLRRKDPQEEGSKTGGREGEKQKATNTEEPKRHAHDKEGEGAQKTEKVTASAPREDPVAEGTGDTTEAEKRPDTNRKTKNKRDRQRRGKKPHKRTTTGKPGRSTMWETPEKETPPNQKTQENH